MVEFQRGAGIKYPTAFGICSCWRSGERLERAAMGVRPREAEKVSGEHFLLAKLNAVKDLLSPDRPAMKIS